MGATLRCNKNMRGGAMKRILLGGVLLIVVAVLATVVPRLLERPSSHPLYEEHPAGYQPTRLRQVNPSAPRPNVIIINCDIDTHPEVGQGLLRKMMEWEENLGDNPRGWVEGKHTSL